MFLFFFTLEAILCKKEDNWRSNCQIVWLLNCEKYVACLAVICYHRNIINTPDLLKLTQQICYDNKRIETFGSEEMKWYKVNKYFKKKCCSQVFILLG